MEIIFLMPIFYGIFIWVYFNPEESLILLRRWQYKEEPTFSDLAIRLNKHLALFGIIFLTIALVNLIFDHILVHLLSGLFLAIYIVIAFLKLMPR